MSPVDRVGSVTGMNFALGSYEKFQPGYRDEKRSWGRVLAPNLGNKANMEKHKIFYFRASVTLKAVSLQVNGMLMMCKIQQAMKDDAIWTTRIHPAVHPGNRDEMFLWQNFGFASRGITGVSFIKGSVVFYLCFFPDCG